MLGMVIFVLLALVVVCLSTAMMERSSAFEDRLTEMGARMRVAYGTLDAHEIDMLFEEIAASCALMSEMAERVKSDINFDLHRRLKEAEIRIAYPYPTADPDFSQPAGSANA